MEIVCGVGRNVGSRAEESIETIAGGEMPLGTEVVVDAGYGEIRSVRDGNIALKADYINPIAAAAAQRTLDVASRTARVIANWFKRVPHLLNQGIDTQAPRVAGHITARAAVRPVVEVKNSWNGGRSSRHARGVANVEMQDASPHVSRWNRNLIGLGVIPAKSLIVAEKVGLSTE